MKEVERFRKQMIQIRIVIADRPGENRRAGEMAGRRTALATTNRVFGPIGKVGSNLRKIFATAACLSRRARYLTDSGSPKIKQVPTTIGRIPPTRKTTC